MLTNPLLTASRERKIQRVVSKLPSLAGCKSITLLSLSEFFEALPQRFYCRTAFAEFSDWMAVAGRAVAFATELPGERAALDRAFLALGEINSAEWHDDGFGTEVDQLRLLDRNLHPAYLRLVEGVLAPFLRIPAIISRRARGKGTGGLDPFNIKEELAESHPNCFRAYDHEVRNGIAHGAVHYAAEDVIYTNVRKRREKRLTRRQVFRLFDGLLDACNALALSLRVFFLDEILRREDWPRELLRQELAAASDAPWWKVEACLERDAGKGNQLDILVSVNTRDKRKVTFSCLQTAASAAELLPSYDRYFVGMRSDSAWPGFAGFSGDKLRIALDGQEPRLERLFEATEDGLIFFIPKKRQLRLLKALETFRLIAHEELPEQLSDAWQHIGVPRIATRLLKRHRDPLLVTNAWVVLESPSVEKIRKSVLGIVAQVHTAGDKRSLLIPPGFTRVWMFDRDMRQRQLDGYGLGPNLVGTLTLGLDPRKRIVDLLGSRVETVAGVRIAWNGNWPDLGNHLAC